MRRRLHAAGFALLLAAALVAARPGSGQGEVPATGPLPLLGSADAEMTLIGAAPGGEQGEAWGYRQLPLAVGTARVGTRELRFGPIVDPTRQEGQLAFLRHTDASGWQVFDTPVDEAGQPYRGPIPNRLSAQVTRTGGGVLVGRDLSRPSGEQLVVLVHDPGDDWHALDRPPDEALLPVEGERPAEALAEEQGLGAVAVAAFDEGSHTGLFFGPENRAAVDGIVHFDGAEWTREPVEIPVGSESSFRILAIAATGLGNAWAIAAPDPSLGRSLVLLERTSTPEGPLWVDRPLSSPFAKSDEPALGIAGAAPIGGAAQPLTLTSAGLWIDLTATVGGVAGDVTLYYDPVPMP